MFARRGRATGWLAATVAVGASVTILATPAARAASGSLGPPVAGTPLIPIGIATLGDLAIASPGHGVPPAPAPARAMPRLLPSREPAAGPVAANARALPRLNAANARVSLAGAGTPLVSGFTGITDGLDAQVQGYELEPPDQGLAAADGIIFEIVRNALQLFRPDGTPLISAISTRTFLGVDPDPGRAALGDPHVVFDATVRRWLIDEAVHDLTGGPPYLALAVSRTSDPLGEYTIYHARAFSGDIAGCGAADCFPDFPQAGYNGDAYFLSVNLFSAGSFEFIGSALYVFAKRQLEEGATANYARFFADDFVLQPAVVAGREPFAARDGIEYLATARNALDGSYDLRIAAITGTGRIGSSPTSLSGLFSDVAVEPYGPTVPETEPDVVGPFCRSRGVTSAPQLDAGYNSFGANLVLAGGRLFGAFTTGANFAGVRAGNAIAYFIFAPRLAANALSARIIKQGYLIAPSGVSVAYPSIAMASPVEGVLAMSLVSPDAADGFPSAAVTRFTEAGPAGNIVVSGAGKAAEDGFSGCQAAGPGGIARWGDYGAATVDPMTGLIYAGNEYVPDPAQFAPGPTANWGTFVTQVKLPFRAGGIRR